MRGNKEALGTYLIFLKSLKSKHCLAQCGNASNNLNKVSIPMIVIYEAFSHGAFFLLS